MSTTREPVWRTALSGAQILFVAFGATVLVPLLTGLNPSLALLGAGIGTLVFQLCTKRQVPIYLGSSFAFIAPVIYSAHTWGMPATLGALGQAGGAAGLAGLLALWTGGGIPRAEGGGVANRHMTIVASTPDTCSHSPPI